MGDVGRFGGIVRIRMTGIWGFSGLAGARLFGLGRLDGCVKWYRCADDLGKGEVSLWGVQGCHCERSVVISLGLWGRDVVVSHYGIIEMGDNG